MLLTRQDRYISNKDLQCCKVKWERLIMSISWKMHFTESFTLHACNFDTKSVVLVHITSVLFVPGLFLSSTIVKTETNAPSLLQFTKYTTSNGSFCHNGHIITELMYPNVRFYLQHNLIASFPPPYNYLQMEMLHLSQVR